MTRLNATAPRLVWNVRHDQDVSTAHKKSNPWSPFARKRGNKATRAKPTASTPSADDCMRHVAVINHEMRSPLHVILGTCEIALLRDNPTGEIRSDLETIQRAAKLLLNQVNNVLDSSRLNSGQDRLRREAFNAFDLVRQVEEMFRPLLALNGNQLEVMVPPGNGSGEMFSDPQRIQQVLLNLLVNANKFTRKGTLRLGVWREVDCKDVHMCFVVEDDGIGIDADDLEQIFTPYVTLPGVPGTSGPGTGLGLSICRAFCQSLGGDITVESEPGQGSRFIARIDAGEHSPAPTAQHRVAIGGTQPGYGRSATHGSVPLPPTSPGRATE